MPVLQVGKLLGENDKKLWRVIHHYVGEARSKEDFSDVFVIGIDETSCKKGHEYITLVVDNKDSKVIFACEGKDSSTISNFREDLQNHNGNSNNIRLHWSSVKELPQSYELVFHLYTQSIIQPIEL